jgi:gamma-glutamyl hercynylcysteine S-oxide synthase
LETILISKPIRFQSDPAAVPLENSFSPDQRSPLCQTLQQAFLEARAATLSLFEGVTPAQFCQQVHPEFSPVGWHLGHIGYTEGRWILEHAAGREPEFPQYDRLFAADGLEKGDRIHLPNFETLCAYLSQIREQVLFYLQVAPILEQERLWWWLLQHEAQHAETITLILKLQRRQLWSGQFMAQPAPCSRLSLPDLDREMIKISAGAFEQGNDSLLSLDNEQPAVWVTLPDYWIDRYPVTQGQYQRFITADGYQQRQWWSAAGWAWLQENPVAQPLYWQSSPQDHPVCGVSWYEAEAYAQFVGKRLPTEAEWEKAASWHPSLQKRQTYPWGEAAPMGYHCNSNHQVGQSTPVYQYPQGQSAYGCHDLLGNIWEWTQSWFHAYPGFKSYPYSGYSTPYFDHQHRVLKGGSWATRNLALRSCFRNWYLPGCREIFAGFRCVSDRPLPRKEHPVILEQSQPKSRLLVQQIGQAQAAIDQRHLQALEVVEGLSQPLKTLPPMYFYDDRGSQLFEQICTLPEYYPTRTETWILQHYGSAIAHRTGPCELVELGSGSSTKTRLLLNAYASPNQPLSYLPIDVSGGILQQSAIALLADYPNLSIQGLVGTYELGLTHLPPRQLSSRMICFLGSTLGNLSPVACDRFFAQIRLALQPQEFFLLGVDLQKPIAPLEAAYNDAQGITAEFNLNMLRHLNRRFEGNFNLSQFQHRAIYNLEQQQIEMYLTSCAPQQVRLSQLNLEITFSAGESVLTEISRKFNLTTLEKDLSGHGLQPVQTWTDPQAWYALILCQYQ